jgi:uncharacterized protein (TIGR02118 family)
VPSHDGASIAWFDDWDAMKAAYASPEWQAMSNDAPNLFDDAQPSRICVAVEHPIIDGKTEPSMVKMISMACKMPGLTVEQFQRYWHDVHGPLGAKVPGQRRYVQNHAVPEAYGTTIIRDRRMTHDGWAEHWFDDLDSLRRAVASPEWAALREDAKELFVPGAGASVVARETVIK